MSLDAALAALQAGQVVGVPTDTVYGLAVDPANGEAVRSLFRIKGRGWHLPMAVLAASFDQVGGLVDWTEAERRLVEPHWPGPLTAVLSAPASLAAGVGDHERGTLAVRIPDHDLLRGVLARGRSSGCYERQPERVGTRPGQRPGSCAPWRSGAGVPEGGAAGRRGVDRGRSDPRPPDRTTPGTDPGSRWSVAR